MRHKYSGAARPGFEHIPEPQAHSRSSESVRSVRPPQYAVARSDPQATSIRTLSPRETYRRMSQPSRTSSSRGRAGEAKNRFGKITHSMPRGSRRNGARRQSSRHHPSSVHSSPAKNWTRGAPGATNPPNHQAERKGSRGTGEAKNRFGVSAGSITPDCPEAPVPRRDPPYFAPGSLPSTDPPGWHPYPDGMCRGCVRPESCTARSGK